MVSTSLIQLATLFVVVQLCIGQNWCMGNNPVNNKCTVCTANDVRISNLRRVGGATSCTIGQPVTIDLAVEWVSTASGRYDVAAYIAKDGGNALVGECTEFILGPEVTSNPALVNAGTPTTPSTGPFLELNGDKCGDLQQNSPVYQTITQVTVTCRDQDKDGVADVSGCTSWNQNQNDNGCQGVSTAVCGAPSKCRCDAVLNIAGLGTCLSTQPGCVPAGQSCLAEQFSARAKVTTRATSVSTAFPRSSVTFGFVYYQFQASGSQSLAFDFFAAGQDTTTATPTIIRRDVLDPCKVQRQVFCGGLTSCQSIVETQQLPRFFHEGTDTAGTAGALNTPACATGFTKAASTSLSAIKYVWTLADNITPCAAEAADGTLWEFWTDITLASRGVFLGAARTPPSNTTGTLFSFAPTGTCVFPKCTQDVELVFVIDEQQVLSWPGYANVLNFVASLINTFTTTSPLTRFGVWFTGSSSAATPPTTLVQNLAAPNLVTNVILPHLKANGTTNFVSSVTNAVNKYWSGAPTGVRRQLLTFVGGPDTSNGDYSSLQTLYANKGIEAWSIGVEGGASIPSILSGVSSQAGVSYQHWEGVFLTEGLAQMVGYQGQILCPQTSLCGSGCRGACTCVTPTEPGVCACPTCSKVNCQTTSCTLASVGCVLQPLICDDHNACTTDFCDAADGVCKTTPIPQGTAACPICVTSSGCGPAPLPPPGGAGACTATFCSQQNTKCTTFKCDAAKDSCIEDVPVVCNDNSACTTDSCNPATGCVNTPITCATVSLCFPTTCTGTDVATQQPICAVSPTAKSCSDGDSCTLDECKEDIGCIVANITCATNDVPCSFPSGCVGTGPTASCEISNYTCALNIGQIVGISAGVIAGVVIAAVIAALIIAFLSKKGYDYYQAKSALQGNSATYNPAFSQNTSMGTMPETGYSPLN